MKSSPATSLPKATQRHHRPARRPERPWRHHPLADAHPSAGRKDAQGHHRQSLRYPRLLCDQPRLRHRGRLQASHQRGHKRGLKIIIDVVANHTAWDSVLMAHPEYYKQDASGKIIPLSRNGPTSPASTTRTQAAGVHDRHAQHWVNPSTLTSTASGATSPTRSHQLLGGGAR